MIPFYLINWVRPDGGTVDLGKYCTSFSVKKAIQSKANIADFILRVSPLLLTGTDFLDSTGNLRFQADQQINVYLGTAPVSAISSDLLSALTVTNIEPEVSENVNVKINAMDKSAYLLSMSGAKNYTASVPNIIKGIVNQWGRGSVSADLVANGGYIQGTMSTGANFGTQSYAYIYKPIFDAIDELSQPSYTGDDRPYIFWVDENNALHWQYPWQTLAGTITEGSDDVYEMKIAKKQQDEINMVVYNAGKDKNGNAVLWYQFNYATRSAKLQIAYYDWSEIVATMQNPGYAWDSLTWSTATNDQVRDHAKSKGNARCQDIFARKGLLWKGTSLLKGTRSIDRGQLIKIVSNKFGKFGENAELKLRVTDVIHTVSDRGWFTEFTVEEDPLVK